MSLPHRALSRKLEQLGGRYADQINTTDGYRLLALDTRSPIPGLIRTKPAQGAPIQGELFRISEAGLGRFLATLPAAVALTNIELDDGRTVIGMTATDIT